MFFCILAFQSGSESLEDFRHFVRIKAIDLKLANPKKKSGWDRLKSALIASPSFGRELLDLSVFVFPVCAVSFFLHSPQFNQRYN